MSLFELIYDFLVQVLGTTVATSVRGAIFVEYASYIFVAVLLVGFSRVLWRFCKCAFAWRR